MFFRCVSENLRLIVKSKRMMLILVRILIVWIECMSLKLNGFMSVFEKRSFVIVGKERCERMMVMRMLRVVMMVILLRSGMWFIGVEGIVECG